MEIYVSPASNELRPVYFSAVDGGIEHLISGDRSLFMQSLVYNLLFQEGGLVVPDVFFFNCEPLIGHVESKESPIFTRALERGLIIPAFRDESTDSFSSALSSVLGNQIRGVEAAQFRRHTTTPQGFAERLDIAVQRGLRRAPNSQRSPRRIVWPSDMGGAFARMLRQTFDQDYLTNPYYEKHHELWEGTSAWRHEMVDRAEQVTISMGGTGIRRAEIFNVIGRELGYLEGSATFDKPRDLVLAAKKDRSQARLLSFFVDSINATYQRSQAVSFDAVSNTLSPLTPVAASIFPDDGGSNQPVRLPVRPLTVKVWLPKVADILRAESSEVLAIRDGDDGDRFFEARRRWMLRQVRTRMAESALRDELTTATRGYAKAICRVVGGPTNPFAVAAFASGGGMALTEYVKSGVDFLINTEHIHPVAGLVTGSIAGSAIYFMACGNRQRVRVEIPRPVPEMNI